MFELRSTEIKLTADVLRQVAKHDGHIDAHRGDVSLTLAGLVEACALNYTNISPRDRGFAGSSTAVMRADASNVRGS